MISRRQLLASPLGLAAVTAVERASAKVKGRVIVDSQVHLWKAETDDWKYVPGIKPQMPEPFTIERLVPLMDEAGVDRAVVVPPSWIGERNDYGLEAARRYPDRFRVMGRFPLNNPAAGNQLGKWKDQPGMLGIRLTFFAATTNWLSDGTADWFWPEAEKYKIPLMVLAPGRSALFQPIAERHPQLTLIIDHMGINLREGRLAESIEATALLAKHPNVSVKLSAAPNFSQEGYPFRDFQPHIKRLFEAFGPKRCYWGCDITNGFDRATYRQRVDHFVEELPFLTEDDKDWIMGRAILKRLNWS